MFFEDDGRLFLCLGIMLSTHVTKTIKSRTQRNYCDKVTNGKHKQSPPFQEISLKSNESM